MKKIKHLLLFFALLSVLFAVCSCKSSNKDKNNGGTEAKKNLIYSSDTQLSLIFADGNVSELAIADFYTRGKLGKESQSNGGTYFGKPNGGTDWYFTKKITDNWYYFELHQID